MHLPEVDSDLCTQSLSSSRNAVRVVGGGCKGLVPMCPGRPSHGCGTALHGCGSGSSGGVAAAVWQRQCACGWPRPGRRRSRVLRHPRHSRCACMYARGDGRACARRSLHAGGVFPRLQFLGAVPPEVAAVDWRDCAGSRSCGATGLSGCVTRTRVWCYALGHASCDSCS